LRKNSKFRLILHFPCFQIFFSPNLSILFNFLVVLSKFHILILLSVKKSWIPLFCQNAHLHKLLSAREF